MEMAFCPPTLIPRSSATQLGMACNLSDPPTFAQGNPRERTRWSECVVLMVPSLPSNCSQANALAREAETRDLFCMSLNGKAAIVTGASSGAGRATALALALQGVQQVVTARSADKLGALKQERPIDDPAEIDRRAAAGEGPALYGCCRGHCFHADASPERSYWRSGHSAAHTGPVNEFVK
jgi:short chain dehydrogenase